MGNGNVALESPARQDVLDQLVQDIRSIRQQSFSKNPRSQTGVVAGQFLILLLQIQKGRCPRRRSLRGFFRFVSRDVDGFWRAA